MKTELEKLESKRDEIKVELDELRPKQANNPLVIPAVIRLSTMLCDCNKMIASVRAKRVHK